MPCELEPCELEFVDVVLCVVAGCVLVPGVIPVEDVPVVVVCAAATPIAKASAGAVSQNFFISSSKISKSAVVCLVT
jgi:hypothetical protein